MTVTVSLRDMRRLRVAIKLQKRIQQTEKQNMKQGKSLTELATELERRRGAKHDLLAQVNAISMTVDSLTQEKAEETADNDFQRLLRMNVGSERFAVNGIAHDQIGTYTGIPSKYYDHMAKTAPELLVENVNHWLRHELNVSRQHGKPIDKRMVRTLDGVVRAFLSDRYRRVENEDLAEVVLPFLLDEKNKLQIVSMEVTDRKLYIKIVSQAIARELKRTGHFFGDGQHHIVRVLTPAITISNSEVGHGAVSIQAGLHDGFCTNLAFFAERSMRKYHTGVRHDLIGEDLSAVLSQETQKLTDAALMATVKDVVKAAFDPEKFNLLVDQVEGATKQEFAADADPVKVVELASRKLGITEGEQKGVLTQLIKGGDLTRFGLYNAVTAFSATVDSYDRATELERLGAGVIELPRSDWEQVAAAK